MSDKSSSARSKSIWFKCPHAKNCGGCQLLQLPYDAQLRKKQAQIDQLFSPMCVVSPILGMDSPFHYRNKVHAVFSTDRKGNPVAGVYSQGTHHVVPIRRCLIEHEKADKIIQSILELLTTFSYKVYNEYTHRGLIRHAVIRVSDTTGQIMVTLVATTLDLPHTEEFVAALTALHPEITTIVLNRNSRQTSAVLGTSERILYGKGYIEDILLGKRFRISSRSFYQVNGKQTARLYQTAIDLCGFTGEEILFDAYCGTGTIGLCAADRVRRLIGVEVNKAAIDDARLNALTNGITNASFYPDDAGRFITRLSSQKMVPDVVIMDPPRSGSTESFLYSLTLLNSSRIVYVSCNPITLKRDIDYLIQKGYVLRQVVPVDMFPCTSHIETIVLLQKLNS